ncbi:hypothetical protein F7725_027731 [Dissostichus mawsoni]|uniref:Deoxyribonuclease-2-alpha n=1 Tax=Dissostichus mawsoni TaxID=36200 RepID=A0A7J5XE89_DISMA|nr:hypothetical protein F7725_027731 [Dissostichus mawsoni]
MTMAGYRTMMALLLTVGIVFQLSESRVTCRNDRGNEVYSVQVAPGNGSGLSYLYMDESTNGWKLSGNNIDSSSGTLGNTLKPLLDFYIRQTEGFGYILYNDQLEKKTVSHHLDTVKVSATIFHFIVVQDTEKYYNVTKLCFCSSVLLPKGVVMLDKDTGVWLSHSTPKFPTDQSKSFWPKSGNVKGQTFLCVTYSYGLQLKYIHPYAYDHFIPKTFHMELQNVALNTGYPTEGLWFSVEDLTSLGGNYFSSFAKYTRFHDDLYSGLIVKYMPESLYVKGWGNKGGSVLLMSNCSTRIPHHVYNVKKVKLRNKVYSDTEDHSKWCVAPNSGWTCIADLNRHLSQMNRGGGAICIKDVAVAKAFYATIDDYEPCPSITPHFDL